MENTRKVEDIIFALPYTHDRNLSGDAVLPALSKASADAARFEAEVRPDSTIVIAGEHTFGRQHVSTGELMRERITTDGIPEERVVLLEQEVGGNLNNTALQVRAFKKWLKDNTDTSSTGLNVSTLAHGFHQKRLGRYMKAYRIDDRPREISEVLAWHGVDRDHPELDSLDLFEAREKIVRRLSMVDRWGWITMAVTAVQGAHVHDIVLDHQGVPSLIDCSSRTRVKELEVLGASF